MLTSEQAEEVRSQLMQQIDSSFPEDKKEEARNQVKEMSDEELERFVRKNNSGSSGCIFCSIVSGESQSYKIAENENAVAVLEINPISKGHTIVLPKKHASFKDDSSLLEFAKQVGDFIKERLSPKDIEIASLDFQGHGVINLVPVYTDESMDSERHHASKQELEEVFSELKKPAEKEEKPKKKTVRKPRVKKLNSKRLWLPKRIP